MADSDRDLAGVFATAEIKRLGLDSIPHSSSETYQQTLSEVVKLYEQCSDLVDRLALFSPNESVDDISTNSLQYLTVSYHVADLTSTLAAGSRETVLHKAQESHERFLRQLDAYDLLSASDCKLLEHFLEARDSFSIVPSTDAATKRDIKIRRFQEQKQLAANLQDLQKRVVTTEGDDEITRKLRLSHLRKLTHDSFQALESIAQELHILSLRPSEESETSDATLPADDREVRRQQYDVYSDRLDSPQMSAGLGGPLLDSNGKPMRPFTLLGKRQELRQGVFRPDHSLPTMSIDEYLDEERRRGGIIDGGGPQSGIRPQVDEGDMDKADQETMKARAWDEFTEANPKGAGNTLNRG